jgi:ABC-type transport system substrate-binding protein
VNGEADFAYRVGYQFVDQAMPGGKVAPNLAKRGIRGYRITEAASNFMLFNMEDPTVGGYGADRIALRRAVGLAIDTRTLIGYAYSGLGGLAQTPLLPNTSAYDPALKTEFGDYDPARAKALLDLYGYVDRDGDGWRDMPDGSPLLLRISTTSAQRDRKISEVMNKNLKAIGIRMQPLVAQWPENLKAARAGKLMMWSLGLSAAGFDASPAFARYDSRNIGGQNLARFSLPAFDVLYDKLQLLPDGPERQALFREGEQLALAYMPYKYTLTRYSIDMAYPQLIGYRHPVFWRDFWQYVDIDESLRPQR